MPQSLIVMNASNYNKQNNSGNSFVYRFPKEIQFNNTDKIGIQSASIFNSFYNITSKLNNNKFSIVFPCNNPNGVYTAIMQCYIGNAVQFQGQISNPPNLEISGYTISPSNVATFTGFIGGTKIFFVNAYISGNMLYLVSPNSAPSGVHVGMFINGSSVSITNINNVVNGGNTTTSYTLSSSALSPLGSNVSPVNSIFCCGTGNIVYITSNPSNTLSGSLFVQATNLLSQAVNESSLNNGVSNTTLTLTNNPNIYLSSRQITCGVGSSVFTGTADSTIYTGMQFSYNNLTYNIVNVQLAGTSYTLSLDNIVGIFPTTTISNVGIPNNAFSILTVTSPVVGNGIYLPNSNVTMYLSGIGINNNVQVLGQFSSSGNSTGVEGVYQVSYNPNTLLETMTVTDNAMNNTVLYVSSLSGSGTGSIRSGMTFQVQGYVITIGTQISGNSGSVGSYNISSVSGIIPSIYPQQLTASSNFSNNITINAVIPDGYYTADTMNKYLQQVLITNNLYLLDGQTSLFYLEIVQNPTFYSLQINVHPLPQTLTSTMTYPTGALWTLINDGNSYNPQIILPPEIMSWFGYSSSPSSIVGYPVSFLNNGSLSIPSTMYILNGEDYYHLSNICPKVNSINSIVLGCNLINSDYSIPSNIFFTIPLSQSFGNLITISPFSPSFVSTRGGFESYLEITFYDTDFNPLYVRDTDITLTLIISKSDIY